MKVTHPTLGNGIVVNQDADKVTVDFNGTVKTLLIKFSKLTNEDGTMFGTQFEAPIKKATKFEKRLAQERAWNNKSDEDKAKINRAHAKFTADMELAQLQDLYLPCQVARILNK